MLDYVHELETTHLYIWLRLILLFSKGYSLHTTSVFLCSICTSVTSISFFLSIGFIHNFILCSTDDQKLLEHVVDVYCQVCAHAHLCWQILLIRIIAAYFNIWQPASSSDWNILSSPQSHVLYSVCLCCSDLCVVPHVLFCKMQLIVGHMVHRVVTVGAFDDKMASVLKWERRTVQWQIHH